MSSTYQSGQGNGVTISWPLRGLSDLDAPVLGPAGQIVCWQNAIGTFFVGHVAPLATLMYLNSRHTTTPPVPQGASSSGSSTEMPASLLLG